MTKIKSYFFALVLVLLFLPITACGSPESTYKSAQDLLSQGKFTEAAEKFGSLGSYEDATTMTMYCKACALCESGNYDIGLLALTSLGEFKDCTYRITYYEARFLEDMAGTEKWETMLDAQSHYMTIPLFLDSLDRIVALNERIEAAKNAQYDEAVALMNEGKYNEAIAAFTEIQTHKDSAEQITACENAIFDGKYDAAVALMNEGKYNEAIAAFTEIQTHNDSAQQITACLDGKYDAAVALMNEGKYNDAYNAFLALEGYKDGKEKAEAIRSKAMSERRRKAKVGDYITFGTYEQDKNTSNGKEEIEWLVLAKENNRLLVISRYVLDHKPYNNYGEGEATWETCTLRKWLNDDFLKSAFSSTEQTIIPTVTVSADENPKSAHIATAGNATQDKVFLLSIPEAEKYFTSDSARLCEATKYAKGHGAVTYLTTGMCAGWWLRSPGWGQFRAAYITKKGNVADYGTNLWDDGVSVRPALWINLEP